MNGRFAPQARYSRYRGDSELTRINKLTANGGSIDIDPETAGLIAYAKACFAKSDGAFAITSGLLRKVRNFSAARVPDQASIDAVLPFIGLNNIALSSGGRLHFGKVGIELDFGGLGINRRRGPLRNGIGAQRCH
jgi:thiamine biosynthesis lipoprotein